MINTKYNHVASNIQKIITELCCFAFLSTIVQLQHKY